MGIIKIVILFIVIMTAISLLKRLQTSKQQDNDINNKQKTTDTLMVQCDYCGTHSLGNDIITYQTLHFCSKEHKQSYLEDQSS